MISHVVMLCDASEREASRAQLAILLRDYHLPLPDASATHLRTDLGAFRLRWELHTEFVTWTGWAREGIRAKKRRVSFSGVRVDGG